MKLIALTWLYKELKKTRMSKYNAEERQNNEEERRNLAQKIDILEYIIAEIIKKEE